MLTFKIDSKSLRDSNYFLRRLWCELGKIKKNAWCLSPSRNGRKITLGENNIGNVSFDYKTKGCINNLYITLREPEYSKLVSEAVATALAGKMNFFVFDLTLKTHNKCEIRFSQHNNTSLEAHLNEAHLFSRIYAYSPEDAGEMIRLKFLTIQAILFEYTLEIFDLSKITVQTKANNYCFNNRVIFDCYNYDWFDKSELPVDSRGNALIPIEALSLIGAVFGMDYFEEYDELLMNSSRQLLASSKIYRGLQLPHQSGVCDFINSAIVSSFEPLAIFQNRFTDRCKSCGSQVFAISTKLKKLLSRYTDPDYADWFCKYFYGSRSSYLHEGHTPSPFLRYSNSYPLIDPYSKREIVGVPNFADYRLVEISAHIFRKLVHDYYNTSLYIINETGEKELLKPWLGIS